MKINYKFACVDCNQPDSMYMVRGTVWHTAFPNYEQVRRQRVQEGLFTCLCIPCLERRLGRALTIEDFKPVPINQAIFTGYMMGLRAGTNRTEAP